MENLLKLASQAELSNFDEIIAPLEYLDDDRLDGPGRVDCFVVFSEDTEGLVWLVRKAERRWRDGRARSALGLLVQMARDGDHRERPKKANGTAPDGELLVLIECEDGVKRERVEPKRLAELRREYGEQNVTVAA